MTTSGSAYRLPALLKNFERDAAAARPVLVMAFGEENLPTIIREGRAEYARLIPQLPDLGGKRPFTRFILSTAELLAVYRVATARGKTLDENGVLVFEIGRAYLKHFPSFAGRVLGGINFSGYYLRRLQVRAAESQQRENPDDYVYRFVPGDGVTFDYGVDYLECASCKFLAKQGAGEFAPYICPADILYSEALGWGLVRTQTLAEGAETCDFRFKRGGPTRIAVPDALAKHLAEIRSSSGE